MIWNPKPYKDNTCTTIHYHAGDTPPACCLPPYFGFAYCVPPCFGLAYCVPFNNKTTIFGIYIKKIK